MENYSKALLVCAEFPYGIGTENVFIKNEFNLLCENFEKVTILSTNKKGELSVTLPKNVDLFNINIQKFNLFKFIKCFFKLFSKTTKDELNYSKTNFKQYSWLTKIKGIFNYYYCESLISKKIEKLCDNDTVVYSYWLSSRAYTMANLKLKGKIKKTVSRSHRFDCYVDRNYLPFRKTILQGIDEIYFVSQDGLNDFKQRVCSTIKEFNSKLYLSRLGLANMEAKKNNSLPLEYKVICTCSYIKQVKNLDFLVDALSKIDDINIKWIHFGSGDLFIKIQNLAQNLLSCKNNISFEFKGETANDIVLNYYQTQRVDLFINCSISEGIPVSIMEAQLHQIPTIAKDVGGNSEVVLPELLLDKNATADDFAKKIVEFFKSDTHKYREEVRQIVLDRFDAKKNNQQFFERIKKR